MHVSRSVLQIWMLPVGLLMGVVQSASAAPIPLQLFADITVTRTDQGGGLVSIGFEENADRIDASLLPPVEDRAMLHFLDLAGVTGKNLTSAVLRLDISFVNYQLLTPDATLSIYGISTDGNTVSSAFSNHAVLLGTSGVISTTGRIEIDLDADAIEAILPQGFSDDIGIIVRQNAGGRSIGFWSIEGAAGSPSVSPASLLVTVPEPVSAILLALISAPLLSRRRTDTRGAMDQG